MTTQSNPMVDAGLAPGCVFGADPEMQPINAMVGDVARTDIPVLLLGESGTGKEVYARLLHKMSACPEGSFKKIPCAAVDGNRFKNEIAGAMHGDGNGDAPATVFLDEIDELDQNCQRTLLSALMHAENSDEDSENAPRLICAASRDLEEEVAKGRFRRELFFRINGVCLRLPPLRERKEDIPALLDYFLAKHAGQLRKPAPLVTDDVCRATTGPETFANWKTWQRKSWRSARRRQRWRTCGWNRGRRREQRRLYPTDRCELLRERRPAAPNKN